MPDPKTVPTISFEMSVQTIFDSLASVAVVPHATDPAISPGAEGRRHMPGDSGSPWGHGASFVSLATWRKKVSMSPVLLNVENPPPSGPPPEFGFTHTTDWTFPGLGVVGCGSQTSRVKGLGSIPIRSGGVLGAAAVIGAGVDVEVDDAGLLWLTLLHAVARMHVLVITSAVVSCRIFVASRSAVPIVRCSKHPQQGVNESTNRSPLPSGGWPSACFLVEGHHGGSSEGNMRHATNSIDHLLTLKYAGAHHDSVG